MTAAPDRDAQAQPDPAEAYRQRQARRAAWEAWEAAGGNLDDLPPGLLSASLDRCMWRRKREAWER